MPQVDLQYATEAKATRHEFLSESRQEAGQLEASEPFQAAICSFAICAPVAGEHRSLPSMGVSSSCVLNVCVCVFKMGSLSL